MTPIDPLDKDQKLVGRVLIKYLWNCVLYKQFPVVRRVPRPPGGLPVWLVDEIDPHEIRAIDVTIQDPEPGREKCIRHETIIVRIIPQL